VELSVSNQNDANPAFLLDSREPPDAEYAALVTEAATGTSRDDVQRAAAAMTQVLVNREFLVVPLAGVFHIYALHKGVALGEPHPSAISQTWVSLVPPR